MLLRAPNLMNPQDEESEQRETGLRQQNQIHADHRMIFPRRDFGFLLPGLTAVTVLTKKNDYDS
jgi:hypothetical protein